MMEEWRVAAVLQPWARFEMAVEENSEGSLCFYSRMCNWHYVSAFQLVSVASLDGVSFLWMICNGPRIVSTDCADYSDQEENISEV